jgi:multidrug efflux pump subunit AcrB
MEEIKEKKGFFLSNIALRNSISVYLLLFVIAVGGLGVYISLPKELFPEVSFPQVYVSTVYPGNSPKEIENLISRPLEKEIKSVDGLKKVTSTNMQDYSAIIAEFNTDVDIDDALQDVKDAVDKAKKDLPDDLDQDPQVIEVNASEFPIMNINLSGDYSIDELKYYAEELQDELEEIKELDKVELKGALDREIAIEVDLHKMEINQISFMDIQNAIKNENVTISAGDVKLGNSRRSIRTVGEFKSADELKEIIVKHDRGNIVYLRDIADIKDSYEERDSYARLFGQPVVSLDIVKKSGENLLNAVAQVEAILKKAKNTYLPEGVKISITNDQSQKVKDQISNLENSIIMGVILVVLVLLFFLGVRNSLFVGLAIPLSMMLSFLILSAYGVTLNLVVLFALILALGMLVDNGIVTVENIYRWYEKGYSPYEAAKRGVGEVAIPIISSTATTLAAFFPLLFWNDLMGEFMKFIPMTLIIVLSSSLFVALVINPVVAANFIKKEDKNEPVNKKRIFLTAGVFAVMAIISYVSGSIVWGNLFMLFAVLGIISAYLLKPAAFWFQDNILVKLENFYLKTLKFALDNNKRLVIIFISTILLLFFSIGIYFKFQPKVNFFPVNEPKYINVFLEMPIGTDIERTNEITKDIENQINEITKPYIQDSIITAVIANVGKGTSDPMDGPQMGQTPNKARITVSFVEFQYRKGVSTSEIMKEISEKLKIPAGVKLSVKKNREGPPVGNPINIEITGEDLDSLLQIALRMKNKIEANNIPGIELLKIDVDNTKPELLIHVDRKRARAYGLSTAQVGSTLRTALFGSEISKLKEGEDEYPINLRLKDRYRYDISSLLNQRITFRNPSNGQIVQVPISAVTTFKNASTYSSIKRKDLERVVTLYSNVTEGYNANEINMQLKKLLADFNMPNGYQFKFTGEQEKQAETMAFLSKALLIAVSLIALILVSQFNSVVKPFIIIISVGLSLIGVFLGLAIFQMDFVVIMTGIGIVSLAGVVVNNAIVLIDYIDTLKNEKRRELGIPAGKRLPIAESINAVEQAGFTRLRPVLLTAITTVLGLIPLATGMNIDFIGLFERFDPNIYFGGDNAIFWGPMAWTVIFGLTFATFLTLIVVPVMYVLFEKIRNKLMPLKN